MRILLYIILISLSSTSISLSQTTVKANQALDKKDNWTQKDLIAPSELAAIIANPKANQPKIFNIGVVENIKGSINLGGVSEQANLLKLKSALSKLPKNTFVVVYCGCCPFERCPNIRPAVNMLKTMGFTKGKLLNLPTNLKQNWIDKGYPLEAK
ncbi:MAG: rhodanese-like domain-containing protein [Daejeonella sp.]|uniref:rhodanese-like domain-containing protein n=1 Tax=Daejeonella sp. TaxID=2805397 RepID=UPI00273365A8|nr:rhodanese-like domain-containing protein [Daejeonella sp.]MDP3468964.1 rhodanese-like domain-containing protein [Daejeonella sp.]